MPAASVLQLQATTGRGLVSEPSWSARAADELVVLDLHGSGAMAGAGFAGQVTFGGSAAFS